jgi:hypothetical protein
LILALLAVASSAAIANAKVIWNDPIVFSVNGRDGICRASPLDRAEFLAWRQNLVVRRPNYPFVPSLAAPSGLWAPFVQTGWLGPNRPLGLFASFCDR